MSIFDDVDAGMAFIVGKLGVFGVVAVFFLLCVAMAAVIIWGFGSDDK